MKEIVCKDCSKIFAISPKEKKLYISKGLQVPKRCKRCRKMWKEQKIQEENRIKAEQDEKEIQRLLS